MNRVFISVSALFLSTAIKAETAVMSLPLKPYYAVGGVITGLVANGLVLENSGKERLVVDANASSFAFHSPVADGDSYDVAIVSEPIGLRCVVENGSGVNVKTDIKNIVLACYKNLYAANSNTDENISISPVGNNGFTGSSSTDSDVSFYSPQDIVLNAPATLAYILSADFLSSTDPYTISVCQVLSGGAIGRCSGVITDLSSFGSGLRITQQYLYVTNSLFGVNEITVCNINNNGSLGACPTITDASFAGPAGRIGISADASCAFVANYDNSTISLCPINPDGTFGTCAASNVTGYFSNPGGVDVNDNFVYIANTSNTYLTSPPLNDCKNTVTVCSYTPGDCTATGLTCTTTPTTGNDTFQFGNDIPVNLFASIYRVIYVPNKGSDTMSECTINLDGTINDASCTAVNPGNSYKGVVSAWVAFGKNNIIIPP